MVAITGAGGYLGRILTAQLETQHWVDHIIAIDLSPVLATGRVISYRLDVRDGATLRAILAEHGVTHLIHAAFILVQPPEMSLAEMHSINVGGSKQVIRAALDLKIPHLTFMSSVAVYGYHAGHADRVREDAKQQPNMIYGQHKVEVERYLHSQGEAYLKSHVAILRPPAIIGPKGKDSSHLRALTAQPVFVVANGGRARTQAIHEDDAASLVVKVIERSVTGIYNAAPDDNASWAEIGKISKLPVLSAPRSALNFVTRFNTLVPALNGFTREVVDLFAESLVVDNSAARQCTDWIPRYTTRETFTQFFK
ncbi:MAG: NAD-dependent epimerase/dehydratase family protein [Chloroflexota bacterium]